jgi:hypothetical protein
VVVNVYQHGTGVVQMSFEEKRGLLIMVLCSLLIIFALVVL